MATLKLDKYPDVCRLCLQPNIKAEMMVPLSKQDDLLGCSIFKYLERITFEIAKHKVNLFPKKICLPCLDQLKIYAKHRSKLMLLHRLMDGLADLNLSNSKPINELFKNQKEKMKELIEELALHSKNQATDQEQLNESPSFEMALCSNDAATGMSYDNENIDLKLEVDDEDVLKPSVEEQPAELSVQPDAGVVIDLCSDYAEMDRSFDVEKSDMKMEADDFGPENELESTVMEQPAELSVQANAGVEIDLCSDYAETGGSFDVEKMDQKLYMGDLEAEDEFEPSVEEETVELSGAKAPSVRFSTIEQDEAFSCSQCLFKTPFKRSLNRHIQIMHQPKLPKQKIQKIYKCDEFGCTETYLSRIQLNSHIYKNHKKFVCETCGKRTTTERLLDMHKARSHSDKIDEVCPYCHKCLRTKTDLQAHIRDLHDATIVHKCNFCTREFKTTTTRNNHQKTQHSDVYNFPCTLCDKKFKTKTRLKTHIMVVHEPKRHACPHCPILWSRRDKLVDHIEEVHRIQMRFICDICVKTFPSQDALDVHYTCHRNPADLQCGTCLMVYRSDEQMKEHLCFSYREDYICCGRDLRRAELYNIHMLNKHGQRTNARVKPPAGVLYGVFKSQWKRVESCPKCEAIFPTRTQKKQHVERCVGPSTSSSEPNQNETEQ